MTAYLPASRDALHLLGITGTLLMAFAQVYSIRKRTKVFTSWKIKRLLSDYVVLGLTGSLMIIVVLSGFVGRTPSSRIYPETCMQRYKLPCTIKA